MKASEINFATDIQPGAGRKVDVIVLLYPQRKRDKGNCHVHFSFSKAVLEMLGDPERIAIGLVENKIYFRTGVGYKLQKLGNRSYFRASPSLFPKDMDLTDLIGDYDIQIDEECGLYFIEWRGEE